MPRVFDLDPPKPRAGEASRAVNGVERDAGRSGGRSQRTAFPG